MASFRKIVSPDPRWEDLDRDLKSIRSSVTTKNLFKLFEAKVYGLTNMFVRASVKLAGQGSSLDQVLKCVEDVEGEILSVPRVVVEADSTIEQFIPQMKSLRAGLARLNDIKVGVYEVEEGNDAEARDRDKINETIQSAKNVKQHPLGSIKLHNMRGDPLVPPDEVTLNLVTCREIRNYLKCNKNVKKPDLWREREIKHDRTPQGRRWDYIADNTAILTGLALQYFDVIPGFDLYTLVLRHYIPKETDTPVPIPIPISGTTLTLEQHLTNLWPEYAVERARKIDSLEDVATRPFDTGLCPHRTNELFVRVNRVKKRRWARWRERWKVARERWMRSRGGRVRIRGYSIG